MTDIQAPIQKAGFGLGAGAGSSAAAMLTERTSFMPQTLAEVLACGSAAIAIIYTGALLVEWVWKKVVKGGFAK